jgi:hypothetical protein
MLTKPTLNKNSNPNSKSHTANKENKRVSVQKKVPHVSSIMSQIKN